MPGTLFLVQLCVNKWFLEVAAAAAVDEAEEDRMGLLSRCSSFERQTETEAEAEL